MLLVDPWLYAKREEQRHDQAIVDYIVFLLSDLRKTDRAAFQQQTNTIINSLDRSTKNARWEFPTKRSK